MSDPAPPAPSVFAYLDYRRFLEDWLAWKRSVRGNYTFGMFARMAGLSRAVLPNVIDERREASPATLDGFAKAMELDQDERSFLGWLVDLRRASNLEENGEILRRIFAHPRYAAGQRVDTAQIAVLTSWVRLAIAELAKTRHFKADAAWLQARIQPEVSLAEVEEALAALQAEGMVAVEGGEVSAAPHRLHTPAEIEADDPVLSVAIRRTHQGLMDAAKDALQQVPWQDRRVEAVTLSIPRDMVPDVLAEVQALVERVRDLSDGMRERADTVVQLNVQAWVVTAEPTE